MSDKQIKEVFKNGFYCIEPCPEIKELQAELKRKEQECEELKGLLKVRIEDLCDSCGASSMKLMPCKVYEKTLTEIKEIAEEIADECQIEPYGACALEAKEQILQKISECEGNYERKR
jgi:hypothetical protein